MAVDIGAKIGIEGEREFVSSVKDIDKELGNLKSSMSDVTQAFGENQKEIQDCNVDYGKIAKTIGETLYKAFVVVIKAAEKVSSVVADGVRDLIELGDTVDKNAQKLGFTTDDYQEWAYVLDQVGSNANSLKSAMKKLEKVAYKYPGTMELVGISIEELADLTPEELFERTVKGLQEIEDETERYGKATELFGAAAQDLQPLLNVTGDEVDDLRKKCRDLGGVIDKETVQACADLDDKLSDIKVQFSGAKNRILKDFLPSVQKMASGISDVLSGDEAGIAKFADGINDMFEQIVKKLPEIIKKGIPVVIDMLVKAAEGLLGHLPEIAQALIEGIVTIIKNLGNNADTIVNAIVDALIGLIDALTEPENIKNLIVASVRLTIALIKAIILRLPDIIVGLIDAIIGALEGIGEALGEIFGPIGEALVGAFSAAWEKIKEIGGWIVDAMKSVWDGIVNVFSVVADWFGGIFTAAWEKITEIGGWIVDAMKSVWDGIVGVFSVVADWFGGIFTAAWEAICTVGDRIVDAMQTVWDGIVTVFSVVADWFGGIFTAAWEAICTVGDRIVDAMRTVWDGIVGVFSVVADWFGGIFEAAKTAIETAFAGVTEFFNNLWEGIKNAFKTVIDWFRDKVDEIKAMFDPNDWRQTGIDIVDGIAKGVGSAGGGAISAMLNVVRNMKKAAQKELDIHSPSKVFEKIGLQTAEGMEIGIVDGFADVDRTMRREIGVMTRETARALSDMPETGMMLSTPTVNAAETAQTGAVLAGIAAAMQQSQTMPERVVIEINMDGTRVATAVWNPLNALAAQRGEPIINATA